MGIPGEADKMPNTFKVNYTYSVHFEEVRKENESWGVVGEVSFASSYVWIMDP